MTQTVEPQAIENFARVLDEATRKISDLDPLSRQILTDALDSLNALHKAGLTAIVRNLKADARGKELLFALVDEPEVRMILAMHGIIRPDPMALAHQVLEGLRPQLRSRGGDIALDGLRGGVAYVRLTGACNGCSTAAVTMRQDVERALIRGVPGVTSVEVLPNDPSPVLIPLSSIGVRGVR